VLPPENHTVAKGCRPFRPGGYTLIELLAVLALLGLVASMTIPRFTTLSHWQLEAASRRMAGELRLLRQEAIGTGIQYRMEFYVHVNRYTLNRSGRREWVDLPQGVFFEGNTTFSGTPPSVHFNHLGRPGSGGTIILKSGDSRRYVIVAPVNGRVRISRTPPQHW